MSAPRTAPLNTRRINLSRVLRLVHESGALSRSAITDAIGLNRSTVADLVGELVSVGLVNEQLPEHAGRVGRPSPVVAASGSIVAIAVNPEVNALEISTVGLDRSVRLRTRIEYAAIPTPETIVAAVVDSVRRWQADSLRGIRVVGVGVAVPGLVRASDGLIRNAPHLGWHDVPLAGMLSAELGLPTVVGNDATLGALAEHTFGAARGSRDAIYLNGGASGIGGGLIIDNRLVRGSNGYAGEFGQTWIDSAADGRRHRTVEDRVDRRRLLAAVGLDEADEATLSAAILGSDAPDVAETVARQRRVLAGSLANSINVLNPDTVVLGGFLATIASLDEEALLENVLALVMPESGEGVRIAVAELGADRLLIGAAEAAFAALLSDPT